MCKRKLTGRVVIAKPRLVSHVENMRENKEIIIRGFARKQCLKSNRNNGFFIIAEI